jgi:hypothetical protein
MSWNDNDNEDYYTMNYPPDEIQKDYPPIKNVGFVTCEGCGNILPPVGACKNTNCKFGPRFITKDSGKNEVFESGAKRDSRDGKGRYDLIPPTALRRLAGVYERGAVKYGDRNWEKGQPFSRLCDSALRHINEYREGWRDEDHLAQAFWNIAALLHFDEVRPDLNDLPMYKDNEGKIL